MSVLLETYPVLYSFRRCPYAMRARMAIFLNGISCELREVKLSNKPKEMLEISPKGTVPVLQLSDGIILEESLDIIFWAYKKNINSQIYKDYLINKKNIDELINIFDNSFKYNLDRYKYPNRFEGVDNLSHRGKCLDILKLVSQTLLNKNYIFSESLGIGDICIFPFIRQFRIANMEWFDEQIEIKNMITWFNKINSSDLFDKIMLKYDPWVDSDKPVIF